MNKFLKISLIFFMVLTLIAPLRADEISGDIDMFPFPTESYKLDNGMEVVLIKYGNDGMMMDLLTVDVGSLYEKKPEEIEYTHLMEHLMFRGSENYSADEVDNISSKYGIYEQGFTANDFTCYFRKFPKEAFLELTEIMADKLVKLSFSEDEYRAETGAVLGEYTGQYRMPWSMLYSKLYQTAYKVHPYRDVEEHLEMLELMPENQERVMSFYNNYYKPNNCRLVVVGDFNEEKIKDIIEKTYGAINPGKGTPEIPAEPEQKEEITAFVEYPGETSPYIAIAYRLPAYDIDNFEIPAIDLIKELYFTEASPVYKRLVYEEQLVSGIYFPEHYFTKDPGLFIIQFKLKKEEDIEKVKKIFYEEIEKITSQACSEELLQEIKEKNRYATLTKLDSLDSIGFTFMSKYFLSHNPDGTDLYYKKYFKITPEEIKNVAGNLFRGDNRIVVTLIQKGEESK